MRPFLVLGALVLASCNETQPVNEAATEASDAVITPQVIGFPDMEQHQLYGIGCAFVPNGGGLGAVFLAMQDGGHIKLEGQVISLTPDLESGELPYGGWGLYRNAEHVAQLSLEGEGEVSSNETVNYAARLAITDAAGTPLYQASGKAQCGS